MTEKITFFKNDIGSALLVVLLILIVLTVIGIFSINTSTMDIKIAGNQMKYKDNFVEAEGGTEVAKEILEQNIACLGFPSDNYYIKIGSTGEYIKVKDSDFYLNTDEPTINYPTENAWDVYYPDKDNTDGKENFTEDNTKLVVYGDTQLSEGSAIQMAAGYEGKGKGGAAGGGKIVYRVHSRHDKKAQIGHAHIRLIYRHLIGQEGECPSY